jgi:hypothetical protein
VDGGAGGHALLLNIVMPRYVGDAVGTDGTFDSAPVLEDVLLALQRELTRVDPFLPIAKLISA